MNKKQDINSMEKGAEHKFEFWLDGWARKVVEREQRLKRVLKVLRVESGLGASGIPHIGSFGDVVRQYGVALALREMGFKSELIAFSDDRDGLRKVPLGLPNSLEKYIGVPVSSIPDPFKCHDSYGQHMSLLLKESIEEAGMDFTFVSGDETYKKGILNEQIEKILLNASIVGEITKRLLGQEKFMEALPYFPVCEKCGKVYTTRSYELKPDEHKVLYICDQQFLGKNKNTGEDIVVKGCGHKGEASYFDGDGKLSWKGEFAARWAALKIVFEAHGKDILDSVKVNDEISRTILGWEPPLHFVYEMFLDKGGKKISKSIGNVLSPQVWFRYATPQSLILLMFRRSEGTREISVADIPTYTDDVDKLEDIYFGLKKEKNPHKLFNAKRLFEFIHFLKVPPKQQLHIPYAKMIEIVKVLPTSGQLEFAMKKLANWGYDVDSAQRENIKKRLEFTKNWTEDFPEKEVEVEQVKLLNKEKNALNILIKTIGEEADGEELQQKIFEIAKSNDIKPAKFFRVLYQILFSSNRGPRLGPYIIEAGKAEIIKKLKDAI